MATIAVGKLAGEPYHAGFFFLLKLLGKWVIPLVLGLGLLAALLPNKREIAGPGLEEEKPELMQGIVIRALKVYLFVLALVFLGTGFTPVVDKYLATASPYALYWINIVSAILANATLPAAEITFRTEAAEQAIRAHVETGRRIALEAIERAGGVL